MEIFGSCYLKENTILIITPLGFQYSTNQSKVANQWLPYMGTGIAKGAMCQK